MAVISPPDPAYFTTTSAAAKQAMLADPAVQTYPLIQGSDVYNLLAPVWNELGEANSQFYFLSLQLFLLYASGAWLDALWGVALAAPRKGAVQAKGIASFTAPAGTTISQGTLVTTLQVGTSAPIRFTTDADVTVLPAHTTVLANVTAVDAGTSGNVPAGAIALLGSPAPGVTAVTNPTATGIAPFTIGADTEPDGTPGDPSLTNGYRGRLIGIVNTPNGVATQSWYLDQALAYPGVGYASVQKTAPGHIQIQILDTGGNPFSPASGPGSVPQGLQDQLDPAVAGAPQGSGNGTAPEGFVITVITPTLQPISLTVPGLVADTARGYTLSQAKANLELAVQTYLRSFTIGGGTVLFEKIGGAISNAAGVGNFNALGLRVNGGTADVVIAPTSVGSLALPVTYS